MDERSMVVTTIRLDREDWELLRRLAELHARRHGGGRASASAVVAELAREQAAREKLAK